MKHIILFTAVVMLLFAGCKKKDSDEAITCKLTALQNTGSDTTTFTYDSESRVTACDNTAYSDFSFSYSGLTAVVNIVGDDTSYHSTAQPYLNAKGFLTSMSAVVSWGGNTFRYTYAYTYDADDHITLCEQSYRQDGSSTTDYYKDSLVYANGNLIAKYSYSKSGTSPYFLANHIEISYTGDANKGGYYVWGYDEEPTSMLSGFTPYFHLYGKTSANLPAVTNYYDGTGALTYKINYSFLLDENGYPSEENMVRTMLFPFTRNRKFTYSCN